MSDTRQYVVGLPVIITVDPRGAVRFEVDFGDTEKGIWEEYDGDLVEDDIAAISAAIDAKTITHAEL